jgi:glycosyltransferase involved in cell wall biosynthesis
MKLSIIIPVYNEEKTIDELLKRVVKVRLPKGIIKEIIVVDDGSYDDSRLKVSSFAKATKDKQNFKIVVHQVNQGKGAAVQTGIKNALGDILVIQDADLEYDPNDYSRMIKPILEKKTQIVYGSRLKNYPLRIIGKRTTPLIAHYIGNKLLTFITNILYGDGVTDMETCYKVFTKEVIKDIKLKSKRFDFEPEITSKFLKKGYKILEVPIKVKPRGYDEGKKISWKDGFVALWTLLKYRFID